MQMPIDLPPAAEPYRDRVELSVASEDLMEHGDQTHYFSCGASALNVILCSLRLAGVPDPLRILDFGAGAGRVTRWLRAAFPAAEINACDLRSKDMEFCAETFGVRTWVSNTDIRTLEAPTSYDLIWAGSVATHISGKRTLELLDKLVSWANPNGLVIMSFHGRYALGQWEHWQRLPQEVLEKVMQDYKINGYGYTNLDGSDNYGVSVTKTGWMTAAVAARPKLRLVSLSEEAWDNHQDVLAVQKSH